MKKELKTIKEEPITNGRPKSAATKTNRGNFILQKISKNDQHIDLDDKHKIHKKNLNKVKKNPAFYPQRINQGSYNFIYQIDNKTIFRKKKHNQDTYSPSPLSSSEDENEFNCAFVPALLSTCGEKTIPIGIGKVNSKYFTAEGLYSERALGDVTEIIHRNADNDFLKCIYYFQDIFNTLRIDIKYIKNEEDEEDKEDKEDKYTYEHYIRHKQNKSSYNSIAMPTLTDKLLTINDKEFITKLFEFYVRHLCKVFLFNMFDRRPDNMLVLEDKKDKKNDIEKYSFIENDFDNVPFERNYMYCVFNYECTQWNDHLKDKLIVQYNELMKFFEENKKEHNELLKIWNKCWNEIIPQYTLTPEKIKQLIMTTTINAKYLNIHNTKDIIKRINANINRWKNMLNNKTNGEIVNQIPGIKDARKQTLSLLDQLKNKDIEDIVATTQAIQDYSINQHFKDDNDKNPDKVYKRIEDNLNKRRNLKKEIKKDNRKILKIGINKSSLANNGGRFVDLCKKDYIFDSNGDVIRYNKDFKILYTQSWEAYKKEKNLINNHEKPKKTTKIYNKTLKLH